MLVFDDSVARLDFRGARRFFRKRRALSTSRRGLMRMAHSRRRSRLELGNPYLGVLCEGCGRVYGFDLPIATINSKQTRWSRMANKFFEWAAATITARLRFDGSRTDCQGPLPRIFSTAFQRFAADFALVPLCGMFVKTPSVAPRATGEKSGGGDARGQVFRLVLAVVISGSWRRRAARIFPSGNPRFSRAI